MLKINEHSLAVDVYSELEPFLDKFPDYKVREDKLQSCSPFRSERHPSFAVNLQNGTWIDSGATDDFKKGNLVSLLAFLREETYEDAAIYLIDTYSLEKRDISGLKLDMSFLDKKVDNKVFNDAELQQYAYRSPYLASRGISEEVQRLFRVGYDLQHRAIVMPWMDKGGAVVNLKFRSVTDKRFWYGKGQSIKKQLYGYCQYTVNPVDTLWITESEIDCLRLWTLGIPAVALGTAHMSKEQERQLLTSNAANIVVATDNDSAGNKCADNVISRLAGLLEISRVQFPRTTAKDISDLTDTEIQSLVQLKQRFL